MNFRHVKISVIRSFTSALVLFVVGASLGASPVTAVSDAHQEPTRQLVQTKSVDGGAKRMALVIGNGAYANAPALKNPANDAREMAATLKTLGFEVSSGVNLNQREMKRLIREFGQQLKAGGHGLFYYAGHGVQSRGHNYIIPVDANIQSEADVEDSGVDVNLVLSYMDDAQNGLNIVILDACRNNPFSRSFRSASDGLAQVDAPTGTLIAYATAPGRVAADGVGENGLYTAELLKGMRLSGLSATEMFMHVRAEVMKRSGNKQVPWEASSLVGSFYFSGTPTNSISPTGTLGESSSSPTKFDGAAFEYNYWDSIKNSQNIDDFKAYLAKYPNGQFAELANNKIKTLDKVVKQTEPSSSSSGTDAATEVAYWDYIKNSANLEDFQAYLKRYPNGVFAELAANRVKALTAAIKEKEKEDEARRLEAQAAIPIKTFKVDFIWKAGFGISGSMPAKLLIFDRGFRIDDVEQSNKDKEDCEKYRVAKVDGLQIREIRGGNGTNYRLKFQSIAEAAAALQDIQRICKATP